MGQKGTWRCERIDDAVLESEAAVDCEDLAGDEVRAGGEEEDGGGDVVDGAVALHWSLLRKVLIACADVTGGDDHAGGDAVDADLRRPGLGHGLRKHVQRSLGRAVVRVGGPRMDAAERADVDDAAAAALQMRIGVPGHEERAAGVGGEHLIPLLELDALERFGFEAAGVVDEDVETAERERGIVDGVLDAPLVMHVAAYCGSLHAEATEVHDDVLRFIAGAAVGAGDVGSCAGKTHGEAAADAPGSASNQYPLPFERVHPFRISKTIRPAPDSFRITTPRAISMRGAIRFPALRMGGPRRGCLVRK